MVQVKAVQVRIVLLTLFVKALVYQYTVSEE